MNLSFAGCGFLGIYHVGVAVCFRQYAPHLLLNKISGASAGAIAACCLICDLPLGDLTSDVLRVATEARRRSLGPFNPSFNIQDILLEGLEKVLPEDAHIKCSGKLHISLTRVRDGKNVIVSQYDTKEDLMDALLASAFVPIFSGLVPPKLHGSRYMDGGFSDNLPTLDENTITVSPFCGESDICPRDDSSQLFHINVANTSIELSRHNIYRIARILFPPKPEVLSNMCKQGFDDALRFLHRNNLINCTRCLSVQSTFVIDNKSDHSDDSDFDPECKECQLHRQQALVSNMPDTVVSIFQEAIDSANKGLLNWIFKHRGMKILSLLTLPYTLPADIMYATITKLLAAAPSLGNSIWDASKFFINQLSRIYGVFNPKQKQLAKVYCHLSVAEYSGDVDEELPTGHTDIDFSLNIDESHQKRQQLTASKVLSRRSSLTLCTNRTEENDHMVDDTFEHILNVAKHHEAIMVYYYMDDNNKVNVTEIFDVTNEESPAVQTPYEREINSQLEFDDGDENWMPDLMSTNDYFRNGSDVECLEENSDCSIEDIIGHEQSNLFSDPESEWPGTECKVEEPEKVTINHCMEINILPEAEQTHSLAKMNTQKM